MKKLFRKLRLWLIKKLKAIPYEETDRRIYYREKDYEYLQCAKLYSESEYRHILERSGAEFVWDDVLNHALTQFIPMLVDKCQVERINCPISNNVKFIVSLKIGDLGQSRGRDNFSKEIEDYAIKHRINLGGRK